MKITIEHKEKQSEDIFTPGKLVQADDWVMLVTTGTAWNDYCFCGVVIKSPAHPVGHQDIDWDRKDFTKFVGTITLEQ